MSNIDFENGLLIGLAIAYKKAARAVAFAGFLIISVADTLIARAHIIGVGDAISVLQPPDVRPPAADSVTITAISATDTVQVIRTP